MPTLKIDDKAFYVKSEDVRLLYDILSALAEEADDEVVVIDTKKKEYAMSRRFIEKYPDIAHLLKALLEDVMLYKKKSVEAKPDE